MALPPFLEDSKRRPYPQFHNPKDDVWEVIEGEQGSFSVKQIGSLVVDSFEGSGDYTYTSTEPLRGVAIVNDGEADLTLTVNGITTTVKGGEMFDECYRVFTIVTITTTSTYRALLRA